ncbi:hypothetical protein EZS27_031598 [termite gut metagenome]|uniref:Uncharacterized protein n=1 Tax=termite gut metagenome TaxID=433724 RepID=A0A5J4QCR3_9ZZZZ
MRIYTKQSPETIAKRIAKTKGKKRTEEQKERIRRGMCAYWSNYQEQKAVSIGQMETAYNSVEQTEINPFKPNEE